MSRNPEEKTTSFVSFLVETHSCVVNAEIIRREIDDFLRKRLSVDFVSDIKVDILESTPSQTPLRYYDYYHESSFAMLLSKRGRAYVNDNLLKDKFCSCGEPLQVIQSMESCYISCRYWNLGGDKKHDSFDIDLRINELPTIKKTASLKKDQCI